MTVIGSGYDISVSTYSPEGRVFQVEYASKAVDQSGTAIGICCIDGVVVGVEKFLPSVMVEKNALQRIHALDKQCGLCITGSQPDGRMIMLHGREECRSYRAINNIPITGSALSNRLGDFLQLFTLHEAYRPLGCSVLLASYGDDGPQLFLIDPSGMCCGYKACSVGKGKTAAKSKLEKLPFSTLTCREGLHALEEIFRTEKNETYKQEREIEFGWVCTESERTFMMISHDIREQCLNEKKILSKDDSESKSKPTDMTFD